MSEPYDLHDLALRDRAVRAARGHRPFDLLLTGWMVADMATGELRSAADAIVYWQPPLLTFKSVVGASLACNPGPHVTDLGITDGSTGAVFANALVGAA